MKWYIVILMKFRGAVYIAISFGSTGLITGINGREVMKKVDRETT